MDTNKSDQMQNNHASRERVQQMLAEGEAIRLQQRLLRSCEELASGKITILFNQEIFENLGEVVTLFDGHHEHLSIHNLIDTLGKSLQEPDPIIRERSMIFASVLLGRMQQEERWQVVREICERLRVWLSQETEMLPGFVELTRQLQRAMVLLLQHGWYSDFYAFCTTLFQQEPQWQDGSGPLRAIIERERKDVCSPHVFELIVEGLYAGRVDIPHTSETIRRCGVAALQYFLDAYLQEELADHKRECLLRVLAQSGKPLLLLLTEFLRTPRAPSVTRAVLAIIDRLEADGKQEALYICLEYQGRNVHQQAVDSLIENNQRDSNAYLINNLTMFDNDVVREIVQRVGPRVGDEAADNLRILIKEIANGQRKPDRRLICTLITGVKKYAEPSTSDALWMLLNSPYIARNSFLQRTLQFTIRDLDLDMYHRGHQTESFTNVQFASPDDQTPVLTTELKALQQKIEQLRKSGQQDRAVKEIVLQAVTAASEKDFGTAEWLNQYLITVDSSAVDEIMLIESRIERERRSAVPASFLNQWQDLATIIGKSAMSAMYDVCAAEAYDQGEYVIRTGDNDQRIYLHAWGILRITCKEQGGVETFVKKVSPPAILCPDAGYAVTRWTHNIVAESEARLYAVPINEVKTLNLSYPGILEALMRVAAKTNASRLIFESSGLDRRRENRFTIQAAGIMYMKDMYGEKRKSIRTNLVDISKNGACLIVRAPQTDRISRLVGREVIWQPEQPENELPRLEGTIVSVSPDIETRLFKLGILLHKEIEPEALIHRRKKKGS